MIEAILVLAGLAIILLTARHLSKIKARTNTYIVDRKGKHWFYLRKTSKGHLFRNPEGKMETLINTNIFKGYKFK